MSLRIRSVRLLGLERECDVDFTSENGLRGYGRRRDRARELRSLYAQPRSPQRTYLPLGAFCTSRSVQLSSPQWYSQDAR
jgi:hypothetical protein